jgi:hypothetical protein
LQVHNLVSWPVVWTGFLAAVFGCFVLRWLGRAAVTFSPTKVPSPAELGEEVGRIELRLREHRVVRASDLESLEARLSRIRERLLCIGAISDPGEKYRNLVQAVEDLSVLAADVRDEEDFFERSEQLAGFIEYELTAN